MHTQIQLGEIAVDVMLKNIKNIHLSVYPPTGRVRISAPLRMDLDTIRVFCINKLPWIKKQQHKLSDQVRETLREYIDRESHYVWGRRYLLRVVEKDAAPMVILKHRELFLQVRSEASAEQKELILEAWYRERLKEALPALITKWEKLMGVKVNQFFVQTMKTKWGSCNVVSRNIRFNTELAKKPIECLEYIVVHEMTHLLEPTHNVRFMSLIEQFMPKWKFHRDELNSLPLKHEKEWVY